MKYLGIIPIIAVIAITIIMVTTGCRTPDRTDTYAATATAFNIAVTALVDSYDAGLIDADDLAKARPYVLAGDLLLDAWSHTIRHGKPGAEHIQRAQELATRYAVLEKVLAKLDADTSYAALLTIIIAELGE